ncbi:MAG: EamA family transporter [Alphaproteobacteria bacterium]
MSWVLYACIVVLGAAGIHIFSKISQPFITVYPALLVATASAFVSAGIAAGVFVLFRGGFSTIGVIQPAGLLYAALVGVCITVAHLAIFYMYGANAPLSIAMPIVRMGAVVLAVFAGVLFFREQLTFINYAGIGLAILAVILMAR